MLTLTDDGVVIFHLSYEEDQEKIRRSEISEARVDRTNEIAINMLKKNMNIKDILEITGLTKREIEKLKTSLNNKN